MAARDATRRSFGAARAVAIAAGREKLSGGWTKSELLAAPPPPAQPRSGEIACWQRAARNNGTAAAAAGSGERYFVAARTSTQGARYPPPSVDYSAARPH